MVVELTIIINTKLPLHKQASLDLLALKVTNKNNMESKIQPKPSTQFLSFLLKVDLQNNLGHWVIRLQRTVSTMMENFKRKWEETVSENETGYIFLLFLQKNTRGYFKGLLFISFCKSEIGKRKKKKNRTNKQKKTHKSIFNATI